MTNDNLLQIAMANGAFHTTDSGMHPLYNGSIVFEGIKQLRATPTPRST